LHGRRADDPNPTERLLVEIAVGAVVDDGYRVTVAEVKRDMSSLFRQYPVLITPAASGAAPAGLESTGDPVMNAPWTALGVPAISIPMPALGLPLGLQLVSESGTDAALLALAVEIEALLQ